MDEVTRNAKVIIMYDGITEIDAKTFSGFQKLRAVFIPGFVTSIGAEAFMNCENLEKVVISTEGTVSIGDACFSKCRKLHTVSSLGAVESIGTAAFEGCSALKEIEVYSKRIGPSAFENCISLESARWRTYCNIPKRAFKNCVSLNSIVMNDGISLIDDEAFDGCSSLKEYINTIYVDGRTSDGQRAGGSFEEITLLPEELESIGEHAFRNCTSLSGFDFPYELRNVGSGAFEGCDKIENIEVYISESQDQCIVFGENCFNGCIKLLLSFTSFPPPHMLTYLMKAKIPFKVFGKDGLYGPDLPPFSNIEIGEYRIETEHGIFEYETGVLVRYIGKGGEIQLPESTVYVAPGAFTNGIDGVYWEYILLDGEFIDFHVPEDGIVRIPHGIKHLECNFDDASLIKEIVLPEGLETIGNSCFYGAENLEEVVFPSTLKKICSFAFAKCYSLGDIEFPDNMEKVEDFAFSDCYNLQSYVYDSEKCIIDSLAFYES
jgi:hypothetical protein